MHRIHCVFNGVSLCGYSYALPMNMEKICSYKEWEKELHNHLFIYMHINTTDTQNVTYIFMLVLW